MSVSPPSPSSASPAAPCSSRARGGWQPTKVPAYHVRGALKLYSRECFEAIGGIEERLGWDTIDETYARMHGYTTRSLPRPTARHHRPVATRGGTLRGRARHGQCAYILRYGPWWVTLRSLKVACSRPYGLSGVAFLYGYLRGMARFEPKVEDERFKRFVRSELWSRVLKSLVLFSPVRSGLKRVFRAFTGVRWATPQEVPRRAGGNP